MNDTLVSACIITYNQEDYIKKCLDGAVNQKVAFQYEIIIGDDCSSDKTSEICREYAERYPDLIKYHRRDNNLGIIGNWVETIKNCNAKYIALCEGDDYWTDLYKLQKQVDFLNDNQKYPMCFTNSVIIDESNKIIKGDRVPEDKKHNLSQEEILSGYCPPTNTVLIRADIISEYLQHLHGIINIDFFLFSLSAKHGDAAYLDFNSAAYRIHVNGTWSNYNDDYRAINFIRVNRKLENLILQENKSILANSIRNTYVNLYNLNVNEMFTDGAFWTPQTAMLRSIRDLVVQIDGVAQIALSIDKNPEIGKIILRKWPEIEIIEASYPQYDAQNLHQFKDESFDVVFSHQVLEHVPKPWFAAKEMNRVLKKGGIGIHTSCAYNPRHGYPQFKDYYRFLPDGLAELFEDIEIWICDGWGSKQALIYNLAIDDGNGLLGGRRFAEAMAKQNDENYPWHTWLVFQKK